MSDDAPAKPSVAKGDNSDRALGVFALVGSGVLGYIFIVTPLVAASRHGANIHLSLKGVVVVPVLLTIGILNLIMGEKARPILGRRRMPSALGVLIYLLTFGLGFLLYAWLNYKLRSYG